MFAVKWLNIWMLGEWILCGSGYGGGNGKIILSATIYLFRPTNGNENANPYKKKDSTFGGVKDLRRKFQPRNNMITTNKCWMMMNSLLIN